MNMAASGSKDQKEFGKLKWATLHGHGEIIESLLEKNTPVDNPNSMVGDFRSPLHSSVYLGDIEIVKKLLDRGASPNLFNKNSETALMLAAKFKRYAIVDLLLSHVTLENRANRENLTHVHIACMRNRFDVVQKLMKRRRDINISVRHDSMRWAGYTPLHFAVQSQCIETVKFLLSIGADITIMNNNQLTPLHLADMMRNEEIIDMILAAHKTVLTNPVNLEGLSHFHIACTRDNPEIVQCFIKNGVVLNAKVHGNSLNWPRFTALDLAIYYDCLDVVKLLLASSVRRVFPSKYQVDRIKSAYCTGNIELVNLFLKRDDLEIEKTLDIQKLPALHYSCMHNDIASVQRCLDEAPDELNKPMWQGSYPLHLAIERGNETIIGYLLSQGADFNLKNADGKSALHFAFERNSIDIVRLILKELSQFEGNFVDSDGLSHLHIACMVKQLPAVVQFIGLGVNLNTPVNSDSHFFPGFTPLHFAAKSGSSRLVRLLLRNGASYSAVDKYGMSAFDVAMFQCPDSQYEVISRNFEIMRTILSFHSKYKLDSFNDRGFSLLHMIEFDALPNLDALRQLINEHHADINKAIHKLGKCWDGYTPLHMAMLFGDTDHVQILVEMGADILREADDGNTPFHLAWNKFYVPEISLIVHDFARVRHNPVGSQGYSIFHIACLAGNVEGVEYFLDNGADPNTPTTIEGHEFDDKTPLQLAAQSSSPSNLHIMRLLLEYGADPKVRDHRLNTPLHSKTGFVESAIIDLLIDHGVDVNSQNVFLETPLLQICKKHYTFSDHELCRKIGLLLDYGADINIVDEIGKTPLSAGIWTLTFESLSSSIKVLMKHVIKLDQLERYVSEENKLSYSSLLRGSSDEFRSSIVEFTILCEKEVKLINDTNLGVHTKLYDFMFKKDLNQLAVLSENNEIQRVINSDYMQKKFAIYGCMLESRLKMQLRRGQERRPLLADAGNVLEALMKISVPRECLERIAQYLSNQDLQNIIMSENRQSSRGI